MVSFENIKSNFSLPKQNSGQFSIPQAPLKGNLPCIKVPVYKLGSPPDEGNVCYQEFQYTSVMEQSLLDSLLLARWENFSWKGLLRYDVTSCVTKVVEGKKKFLAQLNEDWNPGLTVNLGNMNILSLDPFEINYPKEGILFCVVKGDKDISEVIPAATIPNDCLMVVLNALPAEYGHVHLLSLKPHSPANFMASLNSVVHFATEVNSCTFRVFYDQTAASISGHIYFQAFYLADHLSVEVKSFVSVVNDSCHEGIEICEVTDYPIKTLVFVSRKNLKLLVETVSEICSYLQDRSTPFNLLVSECGRKIFLFLQAHAWASNHNLSAWECGGYFIFNETNSFHQVVEEDLVERMTAVSLDDEGFRAVKQLCCDVANRHVVPSGSSLNYRSLCI